MNAPIIKCHNLSHSYSGKAALSNISFICESGEPIGLVGPNGAGKSTLLNILCGFMRSASGDVTLFGHKPGASALSGRVSALPQDARLDPAFSIGEQLCFYARLQGLNTQQAKHETSRVLEAVALKDVLQARHATSRNSGTPVTLIRSPTQRMGDALNALRP